MIEIQNLSKTYDRGRRNANRVLQDVSFSLPDKGFVCILGPSGCGKTSLLNAIGGLDAFDSGTLSTGDVSVSRYGTRAYNAQRNRNFGYIFQNYYLLENHSVAYNVYLGLHSLELSHAEKLRRVRHALRAVDMERYIRRKVGELSGGQQQRIAIARALARRPRVIFADEPTGNLDEANTRNICTLLRKASRDSLVIMVTHEERIARFFADRIITLDQGRIVSDSTEWDRADLSLESDQVLYTGDYQESILEQEGIRLQFLRAPDAPPVTVTVAAMADRIVLKLSDTRAAALSDDTQPPRIIPGSRPVMTLETVDREDGTQEALFALPPAPQTRAGKGLPFGMMLREARQLMGGKGLQKLGMRLFLVLLTALTLLTGADFLAISHVDPQDFITTDSHMLVVTLESGSKVPEGAPPAGYTWEYYFQQQYLEHIEASGLDFDFIPLYTSPPQYALTLLYQQDDVTMQLPPFSYVPLHRLEEAKLLYGRMPQTSEEIVVDRLLLEAMLSTEGIIPNSIMDVSFFLGEALDYGNKGLNPTIVGISDTGERSVFAFESTLYTLGLRGANAISLSELRQRYPGEYDSLTLEHDQCVVNTYNAGMVWGSRLGNTYGYKPNVRVVKDVVELRHLKAHIIVTDASIKEFIKGILAGEIHLYCPDKMAMREYLAQKTQEESEGYLRVQVSDPYAERYAAYADAARIRADARTIVTVTVLALCMVMLYLLCRTQAQHRLGLVAVYRLLGIPKGKLYGIFLLESLLSAARTVLPTAVLCWMAVQVLTGSADSGLELLLPWQAAVLLSGVITVYYILVSLLPLAKLLRLPPAQLAAKYDM